MFLFILATTGAELPIFHKTTLKLKVQGIMVGFAALSACREVNRPLCFLPVVLDKSVREKAPFTAYHLNGI